MHSFPRHWHAEVYGFGLSETLVGEFMASTGTGSRVKVATKFAPLPWRQTPDSMVDACKVRGRKNEARRQREEEMERLREEWVWGVPIAAAAAAAARRLCACVCGWRLPLGLAGRPAAAAGLEGTVRHGACLGR